MTLSRQYYSCGKAMSITSSLGTCHPLFTIFIFAMHYYFATQMLQIPNI